MCLGNGQHDGKDARDVVTSLGNRRSCDYSTLLIELDEIHTSPFSVFICNSILSRHPSCNCLGSLYDIAGLLLCLFSQKKFVLAIYITKSRNTDDFSTTTRAPPFLALFARHASALFYTIGPSPLYVRQNFDIYMTCICGMKSLNMRRSSRRDQTEIVAKIWTSWLRQVCVDVNLSFCRKNVSLLLY